jgi:hypothetical protein
MMYLRSGRCVIINGREYSQCAKQAGKEACYPEI